MAHPSFPPNGIREVIELAKAKPGTINYASSGAGGAPHLALELIKSLAHVDIVHVPYKGSANSLQDVMGGQVQFTCDSLVQGLPFIKQGSLKPLAVLGKRRSPLLPDVPTVDESGVPGYEATIWLGVLVPKGTPAAIVTRLNDAITKIASAPDVQQSWAQQGATAMTMTPTQFDKYLQDDITKWAKVIRDANIKPE
jgi:tripartite-type tricarboxylate transporter receptor subunit TctC